ncbi:MAG TPA: Cof-type HAD-IIB family hydrolase [Firmicutes bacterium]|nr:Cof-type HAD-IIB family hydrolase [Bacillota bacterium]
MELFVSDLDGTLLNKQSKVSDKTKELLNELMASGVQFTIATARTHATVVELLEGLNITLPIVLMNGVGVYNLKERKYIEIIDVEKNVMQRVLSVFETFNLEPMLYGIKEDELFVYYRQLTNEAALSFYKLRCDAKLKTFVQVEAFENVVAENAMVNMLVFDEFEKIKAAAEKIQDIEGITVTYYSMDNGLGYMELHSAKASKANGIKALTKYASFEHIIGFGDNLNDLPMFSLAHEAYATSNAIEELKAVATGVIGHHDEDGVAQYIKQRHQK